MILINHELKYNSNIGYKKFYRHIQIESSFNHVWIHQTINKLPNFITINQTSSHNGGTNTFFFFALLTPSTVKFLRYTRPSPKKSTRNPSKCQGNRPEWFRANKLCRKVACVCVCRWSSHRRWNFGPSPDRQPQVRVAAPRHRSTKVHRFVPLSPSFRHSAHSGACSHPENGAKRSAVRRNKTDRRVYEDLRSDRVINK